VAARNEMKFYVCALVGILIKYCFHVYVGNHICNIHLIIYCVNYIVTFRAMS